MRLVYRFLFPIALWCWCPGSSGWATTLTVTSLADSGPGSLRAVLATATAGDEVVFDVGALPATLVLTSGVLAIAEPIAVIGPGADLLTISGNNSSRIFAVNAPGTVTIESLRLTDGFSNAGGAITASGASTHLLVRECLLEDNEVVGNLPTGQARGGAIRVTEGSLTIERSILRGNRAEALSNPSGPGLGAAGGAVSISDGAQSLLIRDTEVRENIATGGSTTTVGAVGGVAAGGGVFAPNLPELIIERSLFTGNRVAGGVSSAGLGGQVTGGGASVGGSGPVGVARAIRSSTFVNNLAVGGLGTPQGSAAGGGVRVEGGDVVLTFVTATGNEVASSAGATGGGFSVLGGKIHASIVAGNFGSNGPDIQVSGAGPASLGYNLSPTQPAGNFGIVVSDDVGNGTDPMLDDLADNGGWTATRALLDGSPAVDAVPTAECTELDDQRGLERPQAGGCDVGAFEVSALIFEDGFETGDTTGWSSMTP